MRVVRLQPGHAAQYRALMLEAYTQAADAFTSTAEERAAEPESFWVRRVADPNGLSAAFGAFIGNSLVGTVALEFSARPKTRHKTALVGMYVAAEARRSGAGRALLEAAVTHARAQAGTLLVLLTVTEGNEAAVGLYRSAGFRAFGVEPMAVLTASGFKGKVHMWLPLRDEAPAT